MSPAKQELLRSLPSVEAVLQDAGLRRQTDGAPRLVVLEAVRAAIQQMRERLMVPGDAGMAAEELREAVVADACRRIAAEIGRHYRKVINATGIILHTGLGRAVLPEGALRQIGEELAGYSLLQTDVATGERSRRDERIEQLLQRLTGAEAATVVNNNAAATMIVLNTVGKGREVIVSRGQLVEIGGSFRLPEVMAASGARLVEVGTTNKTHARDYENAITENTAAILRVHPSNYKITGFTAEVPLEELVPIAQSHGLVMIDDVGAGALIDLRAFGFREQPTLQESIRAGADLVLASTDKLIGGSQGGIILGRANLIAGIRKNPLARIVRVGKLTLAALEATLSLFLDEEQALREVPTLRMLRREPAEIGAAAERMAEAVHAGRVRATVTVVDGASQMGSGSLPGENLPTKLVAIRCPQLGSDVLAERLRRHEPPIFTRIAKDHVLIDPRTLLEGEADVVIKALIEILPQGGC
jgi:L-seryl-tRNA(Ser) seleniumtransferase